MKFKVDEIIYLNLEKKEEKEILFEDFIQANKYVKDKISKYIKDILECNEIETFNIDYNDLYYMILDTYIDNGISYDEEIHLFIKEIENEI